MRFALENDSISYAAHPRGCDVTSVRGFVHGPGDSPLAGMVIRLWADDPSKTTDIVTGDDGAYSADIAQGTPAATYHLQLMDPTKTNRLSDVIIAEATGHPKHRHAGGKRRPDHRYHPYNHSPGEDADDAPDHGQHDRFERELIPRLTRTAGFELGSGMFINTVIPDEAAEFLRNVKVEAAVGVS